jgi:hypothetical protein
MSTEKSNDRFRPGQRVQVIDPEDGYYLDEGTVESSASGFVIVRFPFDPDSQRFRQGQLREAKETEELL